MIQFAWPWIGLLAPLPLLLSIATRQRKATSKTAIRLPPDLEFALNTTATKHPHVFRGQMILRWLAWILLLLALAQPWIPGNSTVQPVSGRALALAVDVSASMERRDFSLDGEQSDRLTIVKRVAHDFVTARNGDRVSLVLYGKTAFIASPLTFDLQAITSILDGAGIGMAGRSTAIGDAIGLAIRTLRNDPATHKAIVLLSDGTNNAGSVEPESAAVLAESLDIRIHTIALGSEDGQVSGYATAQSADLDELTLQNIANIAGGEFFRARTSSDLQAVYNAIDQLETADVEAPPIILKHDLHSWPLYALLILLIFIAWVQRATTRQGYS